jgi:hypothetical protein
LKKIKERVVEIVMERAEKWASESGFKGVLEVSVPSVEKYPQRGHGYVVQVREKGGKERMATAHFTSKGEPSLWTLDGKVVA